MASCWYVLSFQIHFVWLLYKNTSRSIYPFLCQSALGLCQTMLLGQWGVKSMTQGTRSLLASSCLVGWQTLWSALHIPLNSNETVFGVLPMLSVVLPSKFHNYILIFLPFGKPWWWQICLHGDRHSFCIWTVLVFKASAIQSQRMPSSLSWYPTVLCQAISSFTAKEVWCRLRMWSYLLLPHRASPESC